MYQKIKNEGGDLKAFLEAQKISARDNGRTPFQWDNTLKAGISTGKPWLKINPNYTTVNVAAQESDPNSTLNYFRNLVKLRKSEKVLVYGKYTLLDKDNPAVYAYTREWEGKKLLVMLNFSALPAMANTGIDVSKAKILVNNYAEPASETTLRPYEAVIYEL